MANFKRHKPKKHFGCPISSRCHQCRELLVGEERIPASDRRRMEAADATRG